MEFKKSTPDKMNSLKMENPTLALKLSYLFSKSANRDLRDECIHQDTINRLKGIPIRVLPADETDDYHEWPTERMVGAFDRN